MANRFGLELVDQGVDRSERFIDEIEQGPSRLFLLRAEPQPIEAVVPDLPDLVEETLGAISGGQFDQLDERLALQRGVGGDQFVRFHDIGIVMLAMMIIKGFGRDQVTKCVLGIRQGWKGKGHGRSEEHTSELQSLMRISY